MKKLSSRTFISLTCVLALLTGVAGVTAAPRTWTGSGTDNNWDTAANWDTGAPLNGDSLLFTGATRLSNTNNLTNLSLNGLAFTASGFVLGGSGFTNVGGVMDTVGNNTNACIINLGAIQSITNAAAASTLLFGGNITNNGYALTIGGDGEVWLSGIVGGASEYSLAGGGLTMNGNGVLRLAGANRFTGPVTVNSGILRMANAAAIPSGAGRGDLTLNGGTLDLNGISPTINGLYGSGIIDNVTGTGTYTLTIGNNATNSAGTFSGGIGNTSGSVAINKVNTNTFTFTGSGNHSGPTTVGAGTWVMGASASMSTTPTITVSPGALLDVTAQAGGFPVYSGQRLVAGTANGGINDVLGALSLSGGRITVYRPAGVGTLTLSDGLTLGGGTLHFDLSNATTVGGGVNDLVAINGALSLSGPTTVELNPSVGALAVGTYTLISNATTTVNGSVANLTASVPRGITATFNTTTTPGSLLVGISGAAIPASLIWNGTSGADWDVLTTQNWLKGATADYFYNLDNVIFNDAGGATVNLPIAVSPGTTAFANDTVAYALGGAGAISGNGSLVLNGASTVTLNTPNNYTGDTIVNRGTLILGNYLTGTFVNNIPVYNGVTPANLVLGAGGAFIANQANTANGITFGTLRVKSGGSSLAMRNRQSNQGILYYQFNDFAREVGGSIDFSHIMSRSGAANRVGLFFTNTTTVNGIMGGWATFEKSDWVVPANTGTPGTAAYAAAAYQTGTDPAAWSATHNLNPPSGASVTVNNNVVVNSLKVTNATVTINAGQSLTLSSGGILLPATATGSSTITGGTLQGGASADLVVHANHASQTLTIGSTIADNGGACALTKAGRGTLILAGNNTYTGPTYINGFTLDGGSGGGPVIIPAGTLQVGNGGTSGDLGASPVVTNFGTLTFYRADAFTLGTAVHGPGALTKLGGGVLTLAAENTFSGATTISGGTLQVGNGSTVGSLGATPSIADNGLLVFNRSDSVVFSGPISGTGALIQQGGGQLTLNGTNTYQGATTISAGTLTLGAAASISNSVSILVANGATLNVAAVGSFTLNGGAVNQALTGSGTVIGSVSVPAGTRLSPGADGVVGTLAFNHGLGLSGGSVNFDISNAAKDLITVGGNLDLTAGAIQLNVSGTLASGTYKLIQYVGALNGNVANITVAGFSQPGQVASLSSTTPGEIDLVVTSFAGQSLFWRGDGANNFWDVGISANWTNAAGAAVTFGNFDTVTFDDTSANGTVNLQGTLTPGVATVNSVANNYTFQGSGVIGGGLLVKNSSSTLTILTTNSSSGPTMVNGGTLQLGNGMAAGVLGSGSVSNNAAIVFNEPGDQTIANAFFGNGSITQQGTGELMLTADSSFSGALNINSGTVRVGGGGTSGTLGTGPVTNNTSLTFDRSGAVGFAGGIHGGGSVVSAGVGVLTLGGVNTYAGDTVVTNGTLRLGASQAIPDGPGVGNMVVNGGESSGGFLDLNGFNETINGLAGAVGTVLAELVNNGGSGTNTLTLGSNDATATFAGRIRDNSGAGGKIALVKVGTGTQTLDIRSGLGNTYSGGTVISNGVLDLTSPPASGSTATFPNANAVALGTGPVTFYGGTLSMVGSLGKNNGPTFYPGMANTFIVPTNETGTVNAPQRGVCDFTLIGGGTFNYNSAYVRNELGGNLTAFTGTIVFNGAANGGNIGLNNALGVPNAKVAMGQNVALYCRVAGTPTIPFGEIGGGDDSVWIESTTSGNGGGVAANFAVGGLNTSTNFDGRIIDNVGIIKVGTGTWTLNNANLTYSGVTTVSNGVLALGAGASLPNSTTISLSAPGVLDVTAAGSIGIGTSAAQTLRGDGAVRGSVNVASAGTIAPGFSIGTLTISNALTIGGAVLMEINRTNTPTADKLAANSITISPGATLTVSNLGTTNLAAGDIFTLFSRPITGAFTITNLPALPCAGLQWTNKLAIDGTLAVIGSPCISTTPTNLTLVYSGDTLDLSWPDSYLGWALQTNAVDVANAAFWFPVEGSTTTNRVIINVDAAQTNVFYRMNYFAQ